MKLFGDGLAVDYHREPAPGFDNDPDQGLIDCGRCITQMRFQLHTVAASAERRFDDQFVRVDLIRMEVDEPHHCTTVRQESEKSRTHALPKKAKVLSWESNNEYLGEPLVSARMVRQLMQSPVRDIQDANGYERPVRHEV